MPPRLFQINISQGGVPKLAVKEAWVTFDGITSDRQRNPVVHGGPDRALCLFSLERIEALRQEGHPIMPGSTGENLTIAGLAWTHLHPGDCLQIGSTLHIQIASYCEPCRHNAKWFLNRNFHRISQKVHPGWSRLYARVLREGWIRSGDPVVVEEDKEWAS